MRFPKVFVNTNPRVLCRCWYRESSAAVPTYLGARYPHRHKHPRVRVQATEIELAQCPSWGHCALSSPFVAGASSAEPQIRETYSHEVSLVRLPHTPWRSFHRPLKAVAQWGGTHARRTKNSTPRIEDASHLSNHLKSGNLVDRLQLTGAVFSLGSVAFSLGCRELSVWDVK